MSVQWGRGDMAMVKVTFDDSSHFQLRTMVRKLCDKELAPFAQEIDKTNGFSKLRVSKCGMYCIWHRVIQWYMQP